MVFIYFFYIIMFWKIPILLHSWFRWGNNTKLTMEQELAWLVFVMFHLICKVCGLVNWNLNVFIQFACWEKLKIATVLVILKSMCIFILYRLFLQHLLFIFLFMCMHNISEQFLLFCYISIVCSIKKINFTGFSFISSSAFYPLAIKGLYLVQVHKS